MLGPVVTGSFAAYAQDDENWPSGQRPTDV